MESSQHQILKPSLPADDPPFEFELYTIPGHSGWFSWDNIHEIEKGSLKEFFDGSSFTRNSRVYKEYRDFIITKYREDPSRRLTFSEVRKSLVGDVNYLHKVYLFLDKWGLINFGAPSPSSVIGGGDLAGEEEGRWKVRLEEGPPHGVRVVAIPNSLKPLSLPGSVSSTTNNGSYVAASDFKMPPLSSHVDVFPEPMELRCGNCKEQCDSGHYQYTKEDNFIICVKCFKNGAYGKNKTGDDYKFVDHTPDNGNHLAAWTEAETLLLLESVLKHGDDWDLVAQNVQTKSKIDCISKLIQLPFGQLMLNYAYDKYRQSDPSSNTNSMKQGQGGPPVPVPEEIKDIGSQNVDPENNSQPNGDADSEGRSPKRLCAEPISDSSNSKMEQKDEQVSPSLIVPHDAMETESQLCEVENRDQKDGDVGDQCPPMKSDCSAPISTVSNSLMHQVALAHISAMVGSQVTASAAEAAIAALCDENLCPREIFDNEENGNELQISTQNIEPDRIPQGNDSEMDARPNQSEKSMIPLPLRMRAATATALGAAAAHAKLLAIQEDREVEHLVSTIIDTQLKKLQLKMKLLRDVEAIMEKEFTQMEELKESLLTERMDVVEKIIANGISRWRDRTSEKPQVEIIL